MSWAFCMSLNKFYIASVANVNYDLNSAFFGIIDLLAILPYYVELLLGVDTSVMFRFSILRTFRLLRVFRAFRTNNTITL